MSAGRPRRPAGVDREAERDGPHPTLALDEVVHQRHRLGVLTIAAAADRVEFGYLRDSLDLTPGNLSRHVTVLEQAGLVEVEKGYAGRRPRTWVHITAAGRTALAAELGALAALVAQHGAAGNGATGNGATSNGATSNGATEQGTAGRAATPAAD